MSILINKQNNDKFKLKQLFLLQSGIIPLSFLPTSGLFCKDATHIDISCTMKHAISKITGNELTHDQIALVKNLKTLLDFRSGYINIDGLTIDDVNNLIYTLSID